jgi:Glu-tRNA(Gln) amidotransferase subunit E-like FAD-binding protein
MAEALLFLSQELSSDDFKVKINSIYRIKVVISLCSNDQIQQKMIPMIDKILKDEEDEVIFSIAKELAPIFFLVPKSQNEIIRMLSSLCEMEETVIRDQAVESLISIFARVKEPDTQDQICQLVHRVTF